MCRICGPVAADSGADGFVMICASFANTADERAFSLELIERLPAVRPLDT